MWIDLPPVPGRLPWAEDDFDFDFDTTLMRLAAGGHVPHDNDRSSNRVPAPR